MALSRTHRPLDAARIAALSASLALNLAIVLLLARGVDSAARLPALPVPDALVSVWIDPPPPPPPAPPVVQVRRAPSTPVPRVAAQPPAPPVEIPDPGPMDYAIESAPAATTPAEAGGIDAPPGDAVLAYIDAPAPRYPREALRRGWEGTVWLRVLVDAAGIPQQVEIERSSGHRLLDQAAREQVLRHWRFHPAQANGRNTSAWGRVPIEFALDRG